jgi:hypothetical protein
MTVKEKMEEMTQKTNELSRKCTYIRRYESEEELKAFQELITLIEDLKNFQICHKYICVQYGEEFYIKEESGWSGADFKFWDLQIPFRDYELARLVEVSSSELLQLEKFKTLNVTEILELILKKLNLILIFKENFHNFLQMEI